MTQERENIPKIEPKYVIRNSDGVSLKRTRDNHRPIFAVADENEANELVVVGSDKLPTGKTRDVTFHLKVPVGDARTKLLEESGIESVDELFSLIAVGLQEMWDHVPFEVRSPSRANTSIEIIESAVDLLKLIEAGRLGFQETGV